MSGTTDRERFMRKVARGDDGDCWRWLGASAAAPYGKFLLRRRLWNAHRAAYALFCADIPAGLFVCHTCDHPWCVNPEHLFLATQKGNIADCVAKGRKTDPPKTDWRGRLKPHHWQRLSETQAREIITRLEAGEKQAFIAAAYGVNSRTVSKIKLGQRWPQLERGL